MKKRGTDYPKTSDAVPAESGQRGQAEEALRKSEQRLQDILDNTTAVVFVMDLELRYILVNREYERRHQVQRDQICGKTDFDIFPPDVAEKLRANDRHVIEAGASIQFEETVPMRRASDSMSSLNFCYGMAQRRRMRSVASRLISQN